VVYIRAMILAYFSKFNIFRHSGFRSYSSHFSVLADQLNGSVFPPGLFSPLDSVCADGFYKCWNLFLLKAPFVSVKLTFPSETQVRLDTLPSCCLPLDKPMNILKAN